MILRWKKQLTALVTAAAFFALSGITVCAAPATGTTAVAGLCSHHAEHTAECLTQVSCGHAHTQDCYIQTAKCLHIHTQDCGFRNGIYETCTHICNQGTGCIASALSCSHVHDENCCYTEGSSCGYSCNSCHAVQQQPSQNYYGGGRHHGSHHGRRHC
ncbi:hypothetical protein IMSAG249_00904 [Lachnospiraceae bacterium]|nr:hypothetical protein IMSAG249_00904 [Lachnospiraceae bacterium]